MIDPHNQKQNLVLTSLSGGEWKINGVTFNDINNRILAKPPRGTVELWKLVNMGGGWSHPIHVHLVDFTVVARQKGDRGVQSYEAVAQKDVVLLGEQEEVYVLAEYAPWEGLYMFHCHNLVHEDDAMMAAFNVSDLPGFNYAPNDIKLVDPLDARFISRPLDDSITTQQALAESLPLFGSLGAYQGGDDQGAIFDALAEFYATATSIATDVAPVQSQFNPNQGLKRHAMAHPTPAPKI
jgi:bilirubin oxidase